MRKISGSIIWGVALILLGAYLVLQVFNLLPFDIFFPGWWTLFIIIPSLLGLIRSHDRIGGLIGLTIGVMLLLRYQDVIPDWTSFGRLILPVCLVFIGIGLLWRRRYPSRAYPNISSAEFHAPVDRGGAIDYTAIFGGQDIFYPNVPFPGAVLTAIFGSLMLDLRGAVINSDIVIESTAIFGGVEIFLPPNVQVKVSSVPVFGGVSNKARPDFQPGAPTIYINATNVFGGLDIK